MPEKHKNPRRFPISRRNSGPYAGAGISHSDVPDLLKWDEVREIESSLEFSSLTHRQQVALPIIALNPSIRAAARLSGIGESTIYRWLADPVFRQQVGLFRQEAADRLRHEIQAIMLRSFAVMGEAMASPDEAIRLRAARYAMTAAHRINDVEQLRADLQALENTVNLANSSNP